MRNLTISVHVPSQSTIAACRAIDCEIYILFQQRYLERDFTESVGKEPWMENYRLHDALYAMIRNVIHIAI
jgi:hypothetical protein